MSNNEWHLDPTAEAAVLIPWLDSKPDEQTREALLEWLGNDLVPDPLRFQPDDQDVCWHRVIPTPVAVTWVLDLDERAVVLVHIGA